MLIRLKFQNGIPDIARLVVEPWAEEFDVEHKSFAIEFSRQDLAGETDIELDFSEESFLRVENPPGFIPRVSIDGEEDERPAFGIFS